MYVIEMMLKLGQVRHNIIPVNHRGAWAWLGELDTALQGVREAGAFC